MHTLHRIAALLAFVASLVGCNPNQRNITVRSSQDGVDQLYATLEIAADKAIVHCVTSASGRCHYTLFAHACPPAGACTQPALQTLALPAGQQREFTGWPRDVQACISQTDAPMDARCQPQPSST